MFSKNWACGFDNSIQDNREKTLELQAGIGMGDRDAVLPAGSHRWVLLQQQLPTGLTDEQQQPLEK